LSFAHRVIRGAAVLPLLLMQECYSERPVIAAAAATTQAATEHQRGMFTV